MATCNSTTPTRQSKSILLTYPPPEHSPPAVLFIKSGSDFLEAPHSLVLHCARHLTRAQFRPGAPVLNNLERLFEFAMLQLGSREREVFSLILLDGRDHLVDYVEISEGTLDVTPIYTREVVRCAVSRQATAVVLAHNHPSGASRPSMNDRAVTARLKEALALVDIRVVDHLIVGETVTSMRALGLL
jgi:DNA repair protein RadC